MGFDNVDTSFSGSLSDSTGAELSSAALEDDAFEDEELEFAFDDVLGVLVVVEVLLLHAASDNVIAAAERIAKIFLPITTFLS